MNDDAAKLLDVAAGEAAARLVTGQLDAARAALERMKERRDGEALHDFRVALRRLRCMLRAYRPCLGRAARKKIRRGFRALGEATNAGRDAEVQIAWFEGQRESLSRGERTGLNWILRETRSALRAGQRSSRLRCAADFARMAEKIDARLRELPPATASLREVFPSLLREHVGELESRLGAVRGAEDDEAVHAARIRAKRLRYLLEPLRSQSQEVRGLVRPLKALQEVLGNLHDMHVLEDRLARALAEAATQKAHRLRDLAIDGEKALFQRERRRDERTGLAALAARVRVRRDELFAEFEGTWMRERVALLLEEIRTFADGLEPPAIPVERERKYLLRALPAKARDGRVQEIEQGWLPGRTLRERLRRVRDADGERFYRTIKLGSGIERIEIEEETDAGVFAVMWPLTEGCRIAKRRHCVDDGGLVWEIDEFLDRDLALAEVELRSVDQPVAIPDWLEAEMVREVTDEPAYLNLTLATKAP